MAAGCCHLLAKAHPPTPLLQVLYMKDLTKGVLVVQDSATGRFIYCISLPSRGPYVFATEFTDNMTPLALYHEILI